MSAASNTATATTQAPPDLTAPTVNITAPTAGTTVGGASVPLAATASDNIGVVGVQFYQDPIILANGQIDTVNSSKIGLEDTLTAYTGTWNTTTLGNGQHKIGAVARDAAGNKGSSALITVDVYNAPTVDGTKPTPPTSVTSSQITQTGFTLLWSGATDPAGQPGEPVTGVASYNIYQSTSSTGPFTTPLASTAGTSAVISALTASTNYYYQVEAVDGAGNKSTTKSATLTVRTADKPALTGDTNGDHVVDYLDLSDLLGHWKQNYAAADFVKTGSSQNIIDIYDLSVLLSNYGKSN